MSVSFEESSFPANKPEFERTYCACIRFLRISQLMEREPALVFSLDVDSLIRRPLDSLLKLRDEGDILIRHRFIPGINELKGKAPHTMFAVGGILFVPNEVTLQFLQILSNRLMKYFASNNAPWFLDQILFYDEYKKNTWARFVDLPGNFLDWKFGEKSEVWTGKGERKTNEPKFSNLVDFYNRSFSENDKANEPQNKKIKPAQ